MSDLMCFDCGHKFEGIDIDDLNCCLNCGSNNYDSIDSLEGSYVDRGFKAGQQSKQAEVDELKREMLNKTNEAYADGQKSMRKMIKSNEDELQRRIDEALHEADESCGVSVDAFVKLNKILKGNTNDH